MEEVESAATQQEVTPKRKHHEGSVASNIRRECLSFTTSLQEGFRYIKGIVVGQAKKMTAKDEHEATEADLLASKMQVDAADEAESTKKKLDKSY
ncbi:uncharacterized protein [Coffea arabica]|uniref:Uncharacterized protein n=1 Tax=Coffea arabica TaxID=13443 RepID=A0A6P6UVV3_COFAR|nr:uncharacterized protein LOC113714700 [Coffea arabica]